MSGDMLNGEYRLSPIRMVTVQFVRASNNSAAVPLLR